MLSEVETFFGISQTVVVRSRNEKSMSGVETKRQRAECSETSCIEV